MNIETLKEDYLSFEGRLNRKAFILRVLCFLVVAFIPFFCLILARDSLGSGLFLTVYGILYLLCLWPSLSLQVRRLHDLDKSGWWLLLSFIPFANFALGIYILFFKGTTGSNRFGEDPLGEETSVLATEN